MLVFMELLEIFFVCAIRNRAKENKKVWINEKVENG